MIAGVVENTAPQAGNIVRNDVINVPGSRIFKREFNEVIPPRGALFSLTRTREVRVTACIGTHVIIFIRFILLPQLYKRGRKKGEFSMSRDG